MPAVPAELSLLLVAWTYSSSGISWRCWHGRVRAGVLGCCTCKMYAFSIAPALGRRLLLVHVVQRSVHGLGVRVVMPNHPLSFLCCRYSWRRRGGWRQWGAAAVYSCVATGQMEVLSNGKGFTVLPFCTLRMHNAIVEHCALGCDPLAAAKLWPRLVPQALAWRFLSGRRHLFCCHMLHNHVHGVQGSRAIGSGVSGGWQLDAAGSRACGDETGVYTL